MKKSIIAAGAASVALAAMPIVGVFAAADVTTQTDTLSITIDKICSFGYTDEEDPHVIDVTGVEHTDGAGAWGSDTTANTLSAKMANGTSSENLGSTTLGVYCNNQNGYTITTSNAAALTSSTTSDTIGIASTISTNTSGWSFKVAAGASNRGEVKNNHDSWASTANANEVIAGSPTAAPKTTTNDGDFFTITYGAGIDESQAAGTYTGTITYTLAQVSGS